jgi:hypothetical protein
VAAAVGRGGIFLVGSVVAGLGLALVLATGLGRSAAEPRPT